MGGERCFWENARARGNKGVGEGGCGDGADAFTEHPREKRSSTGCGQCCLDKNLLHEFAVTLCSVFVCWCVFVSHSGHAFAKKVMRTLLLLPTAAACPTQNAGHERCPVLCYVVVLRSGIGTSGRFAAARINTRKGRTTPATVWVQRTSRYLIAQQ